LSLRKPALLRLIKQSIRCQEGPDEAISIAVLIRFMIPDADLPTKANRSGTIPSVIGGAPLGGSHTSGTGNSSDIVNPSDIRPRESTINDASQNITPTEIDMLEDDDDNATETVIPTTTSTPGATNLMFRGLPV
jgi:hypothetical protein